MKTKKMLDNEIADDFIAKSLQSGFIGVEETQAFFKHQGFEVKKVLDLTRNALDFLAKLQPKQFKQVANKIFSLLKDPYPHDSGHIISRPDFRKVDQGEYRICYSVKDAVICIAVVGPRNDDSAYREISRAN